MGNSIRNLQIHIILLWRHSTGAQQRLTTTLSIYIYNTVYTDNRNKWVFSWWQKVSCEVRFRIRSGSKFHTAGPAVVNALSARRVLVCRTTKSPRADDRGRSLQQLHKSATSSPPIPFFLFPLPCFPFPLLPFPSLHFSFLLEAGSLYSMQLGVREVL